MAPFWWILAPLIAVALTFVAMWLFIVLMNAIRRYDYRLFEDKCAPDLAERFALPRSDQSTAEQRRKSFSPFINKVHQSASAAQTNYHNAIVGSAGCLVLAFLALACGTLTPTLPSDWRYPLDLLLNSVDLIAIAAVLALFFYGRWANPLWIKQRVGAELLRQYQYFKVVFTSAITPEPVDDPKAQFEIEADRIGAGVQSGKITEIAVRIDQFWSTRKASIASRAFTHADLATDALVVYLEKRVRRQLGWFIDSKDRLEFIAERRSCLLLGFYIAMAVFAAVKFGLFLVLGDLHHFVLPILLIVTGASAAITAYYINQNSRSLIHRYNTQQRFIEKWLNGFDESWNFASLPSQQFRESDKKAISAEILRFEEMMIEELIDWTHISSHDIIELAP